MESNDAVSSNASSCERAGKSLRSKSGRRLAKASRARVRSNISFIIADSDTGLLARWLQESAMKTPGQAVMVISHPARVVDYSGNHPRKNGLRDDRTNHFGISYYPSFLARPWLADRLFLDDGGSLIRGKKAGRFSERRRFAMRGQIVGPLRTRRPAKSWRIAASSPRRLAQSNASCLLQRRNPFERESHAERIQIVEPWSTAIGRSRREQRHRVCAANLGSLEHE